MDYQLQCYDSSHQKKGAEPHRSKLAFTPCDVLSDVSSLPRLVFVNPNYNSQFYRRAL